MHLNSYKNFSFDRGRSKLVEIAWILVGGIAFSTWLPGSWWRLILLRLFGAKIGVGNVIKPYVRVKFPWKLFIGDYCWVGENVWIDNLDAVVLKNNCCISQGTYLCTGSHDWTKDTFDLIIKPIVICDHVWIGAFSRIAPGVVVGEGTVCTLGSVLNKSTGEWQIWSGNPCFNIKMRSSLV